jgi:Inner membrane component of T3SS, cytoplasmic domain
MSMQTKYLPNGTQANLWDLQSVDQAQGKRWIGADPPGLAPCGRRAHISSAASEGRRDPCDCLPGLAELVVAVPPGFALPRDKAITISVIGGPSKGLARQMVKPHLSVGRTGGGADIEIDDPQLSDLHCALGVKNEVIRLCDLDSRSGTYFEDKRVDVAALSHLSEFRIGSSLVLVTVVPERDVPAEE